MTINKIVLTLILGSFSLCAWSAPVEITLLLKWDHEFQFAGYYAAQQQGYYQEEGLEVTIKRRVKDDGRLLNVFTELKQGRADFIVSGPDLIIAIDKGLPAKIIATITQSSPYAFIARQGEFASPAEFSGKKINITEPYWGPVELHAIITNTGGDGSHYISNSAPPSLTLLTENKVDVVATYIESATWQMQEMDEEFDIFTAGDYGIHLYGDTLMASDHIIQTAPKVVERFRRASLKGWHYAHEHPEEMAQFIANHYQRIFDWYEDFEAYNLHQAKIMRKLAYYPTVTLGHTSEERWQKTISYFEKAGYINNPIHAEDIIYRPEDASDASTRRFLYIALSVIGVLVFLAIAFLAINRSLKRTITEKTKNLHQLNETLEQKVQERTQELEAAKEEAESLAAAKSEFVTNMSHELRTPLNAVIGLSELAMRTRETDKQRSHLKKIHTSAKSLLYLINDILDLAKIDAGKLAIEDVPFYFNDLVAEIDDIFRYSAETKGIEFEIKVAENIPEVILSSPNRWKQIIFNLLGNAIKFTSSGRIVTEFTLAVSEASENTVKICVSDTGIGIAHEQLDKLFDPFTQADSSTARQYGGTGLGLSIAKKLTELMGGKIGAASKLHEGSSFTVEIPFKIPSNEQLQDLHVSSHKTDQIPIFNHLKALVIEDQPLNREVIQGILNECQVQVVEAENGDAGIDILRRDNFDIVFLDIQMPGKNGYETLDIIRHQLNKQEDIIIAMTAHARPGFEQHCIEQGFTGYLAKPIETPEVYRLLLNYFNASGYNTLEEPVETDKTTQSSENITANDFDEALIDIKTGIKRLRGKEERYQSLLRDFITREPNLVQVLTAHVGRNEMEDAKNYAHQMKGATGNLSLDSLHYCLEDLENALASEDLKAMHQKLVDLGRAWRITEREVKKYLKLK